MIRLLLMMLVSALMSINPPSAWAGQADTWVKDLQTAQAALAANKHPLAYKLYLRHARRNPLAQFVIGQFHQHGWGRAADPVAACAWFGKAARQRVPTAKHLWGDCLAQGIGRTQDIPAALEWYDKAAADGHVLSLCTAGDLHIQGKGVMQDVPRGIAMCMRAAQAHSPPAMLQLARHVELGSPVPQDLVAARYWYEQAAQHRIVEAQYRLGLMLAQGQGGEADLNTALFWLESAASAGHVAAYLPTAMLYGNAPVQTDTGALAPAHLAKIYLWTQAALAHQTETAQIDQARGIAAQVSAVMPASWRPELDRKVAEHLSRFSASR